MQYLTAMAIIEVAHATVGDYVIIRAASSSVGLAAIQLANWAGATPIAATRRSDKRQALLDHGAKHVIATEETDLVAEVMKITGGKGARIVFDPVGGPYVETLAQAMAVDGTLFIYGGLSGQPTMHPHWPAAFKNLSIRGWVASTIWNHPERFARAKELILRGLAEGQLKPVIAGPSRWTKSWRHTATSNRTSRWARLSSRREAMIRRVDVIRTVSWLSGGAEGDRTLDLRIANATLSQLSYRPTRWNTGPDPVGPEGAGFYAGRLAPASDSLLICRPCWKPSKKRRNSRCRTRTVTTSR